MRGPEHDYESIMVRTLIAGIAEFEKADAASLKRQLDSLRVLTQSGMEMGTGDLFSNYLLLSVKCSLYTLQFVCVY